MNTLASPERQIVVVEKSSLIHEQFSIVARQCGTRPALTFDKNTYTYGEVEKLSNQLAHHLILKGITPGTAVAVMFSKGTSFVIAVLAVLKAGGYYVPLDPEYPSERVRRMLDLCKARILLTDEFSELIESAGYSESSTDLCRLPERDKQSVLTSDWEAVAHEPVTCPGVALTKEDKAYLIFTSGTTGLPKGVINTHGCVSNLCEHYREQFNIDGEEKFTQIPSYCFDASVAEIFSALLSGGHLHVFPSLKTTRPEELLNQIAKREITFTTFSPTAMKLVSQLLTPEMVSRLGSLKTILVGGEPLTCAVARSWLNKLDSRVALYNIYGPTETTVFSTTYRVDLKTIEQMDPGQILPIGNPIKRTQVHILDEQMNVVDAGVEGEIYIGGAGVSSGYYDDPSSTAASFVSTPHSQGEIVYKTGDLGRINDLGQLEICGRADKQIKLRGYRIEPTEIETLISQVDRVEEALVVPSKDEVGNTRLIAYCVTPDLSSTDSEFFCSVAEHLRAHLPEHMLPSRFVGIAHIPMTTNGKVDTTKLPVVNWDEDEDRIVIAGVTENERLLIDGWRQVLSRRRIDRQDNFYHLGGDSIAALRLVTLLRVKNKYLKQQDIHTTPRLCDLARCLRDDRADDMLSYLPATGKTPLAPIQRWFFEQNLENLHAYHQSLEFETKETLSVNALRQAIAKIIRRHEQLRTRFIADNDDYRVSNVTQIIVDDCPDPIVEVMVVKPTDNEMTTVENFRQQLKKGIRINSAPLLRAGVVRRPCGGTQVIVVAHHLIVDTVSWTILLCELRQYYDQIFHGNSRVPDASTHTYQQWTSQLHEQLGSDSSGSGAGAESLTHESSAGADVHSSLTDVSTVDDWTIGSMEHLSYTLCDTRTQDLVNNCGRSYNVTAEDLILTALGLAITCTSGKNDFSVDVEWHGREAAVSNSMDLTGTVGWFTCISPLSFRLEAGLSISDSIIRVKEMRRALESDRIAHSCRRHLSNPEASHTSRQPACDVVFNYSGKVLEGVEGWTVLPISAVESDGVNSTPYALAIEAGIKSERLEVDIFYQPGAIDSGRIDSLIEHWRNSLDKVIGHCATTETVQKSPSDFPGSNLTLNDIRCFPQSVDDAYPLSSLQKGILYHAIADQSSSAYLVQVLYRIRAPLDVSTFNRAFNVLVERNDSLRVSVAVDGLVEPLQLVNSKVNVSSDVLGVESTTRDIEVSDYMSADLALGMDVTRAPLFRTCVIADGGVESFDFLLTIHHIIHDGWSLTLLMSELEKIYLELLEGGCVSEVAQSRPSFKQYVLNQNALENNPEEIDFWEKYTATIQQSELPTTAPAERSVDNLPSTSRNIIDNRVMCQHLLDSLRQTAIAHDVTLNTVFLSAYALLLRQLTGAELITTGVVTAGRSPSLVDSDRIIGCCLNTLPLSVAFKDEDGQTVSTRVLLQSTQAALADLADHTMFPLPAIARLKTPEDGVRVNLFDTTYDFESYDKILSSSTPGPEIVGGYEMTNYGFELNILEQANSVSYRFTYDPNRFSPTVTECWIEQFEHILRSLADLSPATTDSIHCDRAAGLSALALDRLESFHGPRVNHPIKSIHHYVASHALKNPNSIAVRCGEQQITYADIHLRSSRLAEQLIMQGVTTNQPVAVLLDRSIDLVVTAVAVWKAGGAYVPLDPEYPLDRTQKILSTSQISIGITNLQAFSHRHTDIDNCNWLFLEKLHKSSVEVEPKNVDSTFSMDSLSYVIFTSGSTGEPKGAMIEHRGMMNNIHAEIAAFKLDASTSVAQTASQCFDVSVWQLFAALVAGGTTCIYSKDLQLDPEAFIEHSVKRDKVSVMQLVPSYLNELLEYLETDDVSLDSLKMLSTTGEAINRPLLVRWFMHNPGIPVLNAYGPAEASDDVSHYIFDRAPAAEGYLAIGKPTPNTLIYVVDESFDRCPIGVTGEICIAGDGVGRGYINDASRTADVFIANPFVTDSSVHQRLYRTGDFGRWRSDGVLEFVGRRDQQVKVNGYRIELGDIESHLNAHPQIREACVTLSRVGASNDRQTTGLTAWMSPVVGLSTKALDCIEDYLRERLPAHMVPQYFNALAELPKNNNGKLDRSGLAARDPRFINQIDKTEAPKPSSATGNNVDVLIDCMSVLLGCENADAQDSFFQLGGDSLIAIQLVMQLKKHGYRLSIADIFRSPELVKLAQHLQAESTASSVIGNPIDVRAPDNQSVAERPRERFVELQQQLHQHIALDQLQDVYPLTPLQEGILFHHAYAGTKGAYNGRYSMTIKGDIDPEALDQALNGLIRRHESLRTAFVYKKLKQPCQIVFKQRPGHVSFHDFSDLADDDAEAVIDRLISEKNSEPFDLENDVLIRLTLVKVRFQEFRLFIHSHHIVMDGWSVSNLNRELLQLYLSLDNGASLDQAAQSLPSAPSFGDHIRWQLRQDKESARQFFSDYFKDFEPGATSLPCLGMIESAQRKIIDQSSCDESKGHQASPAEVSRCVVETDFQQYSHYLSKDLTQRFETMARENDTTVTAVFQAMWGLLLQRYTYSKDVAFGSVVSGRNTGLTGVDRMVGSLINTIALRVKCGNDERFIDLARRIQHDQLDAESHAQLSLSEIARLAKQDVPLFDHILVSDSYPVESNSLDTMDGGLSFEFSEVEGGAETNYSFAILTTLAERFRIKFEYDANKINMECLRAISLHLEAMLTQLVDEPTRSIADIQYLSEDEKKQTLVDFNRTDADYSGNADLLDAFSTICQQQPDRIALNIGGQKLSFAALDVWSDNLALQLRKMGVGKDVVVAQLFERSLELVVSILAIHKAGGAFLPIDPLYPDERLAFVLDDSQATVCLVQEKFQHRRAALGQTSVEFVVLTTAYCDELRQVLAQDSAAPLRLPSQRDPDSLAYVLYTSGSTGMPKGVMIEDAAIKNRLVWMAAEYEIDATDIVLQKTVYTFDVSVWELLLPLMTGAQMVLLPQGDEKSPRRIVETIISTNVTVLHFVPSMLSAFLDDLPIDHGITTLRQCFCSGEALTAAHSALFHSRLPGVELHNLYGPTEAAIDVSFYEVAVGVENVPIGKPVANTQLYIHDQFANCVPVGITGELLIGGVQVARGYVNRDELSAQRFICDPALPSQRVYRTGDLARWNANGEVEYLGRVDHQVKIRGRRIELGEIENTLNRHDQIVECAVMAKSHGNGSDYLAAYCVVREAISDEALETYLASSLPEYMVPQVFVRVDEMPHTSSGKIDRKQLPDPVDGDGGEDIHVAPINDRQRLLAKVWRDVLNIENIGIDDNFFHLRGDSILAIQIASRLFAENYRLEVEDVFNHPTIRGLADCLQPVLQRVDQVAVAGSYSPTPIQRWFLEEVETSRHHWNQSILLTREQGFDLEHVTTVYQFLLRHHDGLRTRICVDQSDTRLEIVDPTQLTADVPLIDLRSQDDASLESATTEIQQSMRLEAGPLLRMAVFRTDAGDQLLICAHHLIVDGVSWRILLEDVGNLVTQIETNQKLRLPLKTHSFKQWAEALEEYIADKELTQELDYWATVGTYAQKLQKDVDVDRTVTSEYLRSERASISVQDTDLLLQRCNQAFNTEVTDLLLSSFASALSQWRHRHEHVIHLEAHGREEFGANLTLDRTIGWFTSLFPVCLKANPGSPVGQHITQTKERLRAVPRKGIGYGLLRYLDGVEKLDRHQLQRLQLKHEIAFNYIGQLSDENLPAGLKMLPEGGGREIAEDAEVIFPIDVTAYVINHALEIKLEYDSREYTQTEAIRLVEQFTTALSETIAFCTSERNCAFTASDFSDDDLDGDDFKSIMDAIEDQQDRSQDQVIH